MTVQMLMLIEVTGIQSYIFASNQLAQNIGASELVLQATSTWISKALPEPNNFNSVVSAEPDDRTILGDGLAAEVIYAGGAKAAILFADEEKAVGFARTYTACVIKKAPGLQLVLKRKAFDPGRDVLKECYRDLRKELEKRKRDRPFSVPLAGLGVTATCVYTGAPAVDFREDHLISAEVEAKLRAASKGKERLKQMLPQVEEAGYEFTYDFSDFGTKDESSYIAVIHADGNNMGKRLEELGRGFTNQGDNAAYVLAVRRFSEAVRNTAEQALRETVAVLLHPDNLSDGMIGGKVPVPKRGEQRMLPFRPIVFGGDDVTFVSEGRLGLALAARYLTELHALDLSDGKPAYARAGVAVVKSHYPFSRAYELSEALCGSAKTLIRKWEEEGEAGMSALDWHFAATGLVLPLDELRKREYKCPSGSLLMRPIALRNPRGDWRSWETFNAVVEGFRNEKGEWAGRRNKIKALREALRGGPDATALFLRGIKQGELPPIPNRRDMKTRGWHGVECGYFDVIESLDFYVPLLKGGQPI